MRKVNFKNNSIYYSLDGENHSKVPLVLLHGFLEDCNIWNAYREDLALERQIICIDLPGHGRSKDFAGSHSMQVMAEIVAFVLKDIGLQQVSMAGHSMGGYVGLEFLHQYPQFIQTFMLINSTPYADSPNKVLVRNRAIEFVANNKDVFVSMAISNLFPSESRRKYGKEIEALKQRASKLNSNNIQQALIGMRDRQDRTHTLKNFNGNKIMIAGREDVLVDLAESEKAAMDTNATLIVLENGHNSWLESSKNLLDEFLLIE